MSTIDEKYLGDRVKELENRITDTVTEGSTDVPTSDAVYSAIQSAGSGIEFITPLPFGEASNTDNLFLSNDGSAQTNPRITTNTYSVRGNYFYAESYGAPNVFIWLNMGSYGLTTVDDFLNHIIINILQSQNTASYIAYVHDFTQNPPIIASNHTGYILFPIFGKGTFNVMYMP